MRAPVDDKAKVRSEYIDWLEFVVGIDTSGGPFETYTKLFNALFDVEYYSFYPRDENRGYDGMSLRETYFADKFANENSVMMDGNGDIDEELEGANVDIQCARFGTCRFIEFMIGMAKRMSYEIFSAESENSIGRCFFELLRNIGLDVYTDAVFDAAGGLIACKNVAGDILDHRYDADGNGCFFPLHKTETDMRKLEFWDQLNVYLNENYSIC